MEVCESNSSKGLAVLRTTVETAASAYEQETNENAIDEEKHVRSVAIAGSTWKFDTASGIALSPMYGNQCLREKTRVATRVGLAQHGA